jgi:hypothetical protein
MLPKVTLGRANKSRGSDGDSGGELWSSKMDGTTQIALGAANTEFASAAMSKNLNFGPNFQPIAGWSLLLDSVLRVAALGSQVHPVPIVSFGLLL